MYIWVALDTSEALSAVRSRAILENLTVGLSEVAFSLPQHISLKISFYVDDCIAEAVIESLTAFFKTIPQMPVRPLMPEEKEGLLWVKIEESDYLISLHVALDEKLFREFGVTPHPFDRAFLFHSTLFQDADQGKISLMAERISDLVFSEEILPQGFLIGVSESGRAGSYQVVKTIPF